MFDYGTRTIPQLITDWNPTFNDKWKAWIDRGFALYSSSTHADRLEGFKQFTIILGDSGAPEACVLVALGGLTIAASPEERVALEVHIRTVTHRMGLEVHREYNDPAGGVPIMEFQDRTSWLINRPAFESWRDKLLADFDGDRQNAADCCVFLAAVRGGALHGDHPLTAETLQNKDLWQRRV